MQSINNYKVAKDLPNTFDKLSGMGLCIGRVVVHPHINQHLKRAIDTAFAMATGKRDFAKLTTQLTKLTASGKRDCAYYQRLLKTF